MMNDGDENENAMSDITAGEKQGEEASRSAPEESSSSGAPASESAPEAEEGNDSEGNIPLPKKILNAATSASATAIKITGEVGTAAMKVTTEVVEKVGHASHQAFDSAGNVVRKLTNKDSTNVSAPDSEKVDAEVAGKAGQSPDAEVPQKEGSSESDATEKVSLWAKVRRASGTAASAAAEAAQAAYKAAEPVAQSAAHKVADGAKSAYEKAKPVAESAVHKTAEVSAAAWVATKDTTMRAVERVRSMSSIHPKEAVSGDDNSSNNDTTKAETGSASSATRIEDSEPVETNLEPSAAAEDPKIDSDN